MANRKKELTQQFLLKVEVCGYNNFSCTKTAEVLKISRRWLYELRKRQEYSQAWQAGRTRAAQDFFTTAGAAELDRLENEAKALHIDNEVEILPGYEVNITREELPGGGYREIITQTPKALPSFEELKKQAIKRRTGDRRGLYDF